MQMRGKRNEIDAAVNEILPESQQFREGRYEVLSWYNLTQRDKNC